MKKIKILLSILLSITVIGLSYDLYRLGVKEELWGFRPLVLFLSFWLLVVMLFGHKFSKSPKNNRWLMASTLSGVLLGLGFPGVLPVPVLMFAGFVPLLIVEHELTVGGEKVAPWTMARFSYHAFVLWNIISTFWVANTELSAGIFAIAVNSLLMCIPFVLFHLSKRIMPRLAYFSFIVYWLTFEYIHLNWELTWPWLTLGNSFAQVPVFVQWYEFTGVFGGSLWILTANVLIFRWWLARQAVSPRPSFLRLFQVIALLGIPGVLSLVRYYNYEEEGYRVSVAVVQPNYEPHYEKFTVPVQSQMERILKLSGEVVDENTDYLVLPESSFGYAETHDLQNYGAVLRLKEFIRVYPKLKLVSGFNAFTQFLPGEPLTKNTQIHINDLGDTTYYETLNIALQLSNETEAIPIYKKSRLVPGPEIFPYQGLLYVFKPIVDQLGGTTAGVGTQPERSVFTSKAGKVAPVICYESVFGEYFTEYIHAGAQAVFIVTNDGWWDNTAGHRQHLYFASLRAIETRKTIARSAYTGVSAFINQRGDIRNRTIYGEADAIKDTILFNDRKTFYVKWGDIIGRVAVFSCILLVLNSIVRAWYRRVQRD